MIQHDNKFKPGNPNWKPGQSGNPRGRPVGSRQKIAEQLLTAFAAVLDEDPVVALRELKQNDPAKFWTIASGLLPRETMLSVQQVVPGNLTPEQWGQLRSVLELIERHAPNGAEPGEVFQIVERALVAAYEAPPEPLQIGHAPALALETVTTLPPPPYRAADHISGTPLNYRKMPDTFVVVSRQCCACSQRVGKPSLRARARALGRIIDSTKSPDEDWAPTDTHSNPAPA